MSWSPEFLRLVNAMHYADEARWASTEYDLDTRRFANEKRDAILTEAEDALKAWIVTQSALRPEIDQPPTAYGDPCHRCDGHGQTYVAGLSMVCGRCDGTGKFKP